MLTDSPWAPCPDCGQLVPHLIAGDGFRCRACWQRREQTKAAQPPYHLLVVGEGLRRAYDQQGRLLDERTGAPCTILPEVVRPSSAAQACSPVTAAVTETLHESLEAAPSEQRPKQIRCEVCGQPLASRRRDARLCSARCRQQASRERRRQPLRRRRCRGCGEWFLPRRRSQWYGSPRCRMRGLRWRRVQTTVQRWRREERALKRRGGKR